MKMTNRKKEKNKTTHKQQRRRFCVVGLPFAVAGCRCHRVGSAVALRYLSFGPEAGATNSVSETVQYRILMVQCGHGNASAIVKLRAKIMIDDLQ